MQPDTTTLPPLPHPSPPLHADLEETRTEPPPVRPSAPRPRVLAAVGGVLGLVALFLWAPQEPSPRPRVPRDTAGASPPSPTPTQVPATPPPSPLPASTSPLAAKAPASAPAAPRPGRLRIDFDHPLRLGRLRVFVDGALELDEQLTGQERTKALVFKLHEGTFRDELDVAPGMHDVRVEVTWDDVARVERIAGRFRPGETRRLDASLGRMSRDLSLAWR
jgi:hypothetical protein